MSSLKWKTNLFGYQQYHTDNGIIAKIDPEQKKVIERIFRLFIDDRLPLNAIADKLNEDATCLTALSNSKSEYRFHATTIRKILKRPEYLDTNKEKSHPLSDTFEGFIDPEDWYHAQYLLLRKSKSNRGSIRQAGNPLTGLINCFICEKKYYIKEKANIYRHIQNSKNDKKKGGKDFCSNTDSFIANKTNELVYALILEYLTRPKFLRHKLKQLQLANHYSQDRSDGKLKPSVPYPYMDTAIHEARWNLNHWGQEQNKSQQTFNTIDETIIDRAIAIQNAHTELLSEASDYFEKAIRNWFSSTLKSAKLDLIIDSIESIVVLENFLHISFYRDLNFRIPIDYYKKKSNHWVEKQQQLSNLDGTRWRLYQMEKYISDHVNDLMRAICHEEESAGLQEANSFKLTFMQQGFISNATRFFLPINDYICLEDTKEIKSGLWSFQYGNQGTVYLGTTEPQSTESAIHRNGTLIYFELRGKSFINAKYIHRLPEWFYGHNYEYFLADKKRICFIEEDSRIHPMVLNRGGTKTALDRGEAFRLIKESSSIKYIEID